jgi:hypothetical protein
MQDSLKLRGEVRSYIVRDGKIINDTTIRNTITNASFAVISGLAGNTGSQTAFTYLAVGTDSTAAAATQTALLGEITDTGLARAAATVSRVTTTQTNDTLRLQYTWTASGSKTVQEAGIFNASSSGTMLGRALTGAKALTANDLFVVQYNVKFA